MHEVFRSTLQKFQLHTFCCSCSWRIRLSAVFNCMRVEWTEELLQKGGLQEYTRNSWHGAENI